jgi:hypothetical protein
MRLLASLPSALLLSLMTPYFCAAMPTTAADSDQERISSRGEDTPQFYNAANHPGADPFVLYDSSSGRYYAYSTEGADQGYHFAIYSSPDLSTWHKHPGGALKGCGSGQVEDGQGCWARDWFWAPETYHNEKTGWYFFFFAARLRTDITKDHFRYSAFEEPSKLGVAVSRSPTGPFKEIKPEPIDYYPYDPDYYDVNLIMDEKQMLPPKTLEEGRTAPKGTYIPTIDPNVFFDKDGRIYLYTSRNAYRNWNWDKDLGKYIEESNIIAVELERDWWDDPTATTMPKIVASQIDLHGNAPGLPDDIASYNGTGEIGQPPRKDGWTTVLSYGADPQEWENYHVDDYSQTNGAKKDRRWSEGSTLLTRPDAKTGKPVYLLTFSANNFEASNYGVGFATAESPLGPFKKSANNPVLSQAPDGEHPIYSTGHGCVVASPPRGNRNVGAQDVTRETLDGTELFYIHHARNDTANSRSIYSTRMTLDVTAVSYGSDNAISMHLTPLDQPLPKETYPIQLEAKRVGRSLRVRVFSKTGAPFDMTEGSNRVIGLPGDVVATSIRERDGHDGDYLVEIGDASVKSLAYQRLSVDGSWTTVAQKKIARTYL